MTQTTWTRVLACLVLSALVATGCKDETSGSEADGSSTTEHASKESAGSGDIARDQSRSGPTENGDFYLEVRPHPNPIPFQSLFELEVTIFESADADSPLEGASLDEVRATMPAHDHGMKTDPKLVEEAPGTYRIRGMKFHMKGSGEDGRWVLHLTVRADGTIDTAKFDVQCCRTQ